MCHGIIDVYTGLRSPLIMFRLRCCSSDHPWNQLAQVRSGWGKVDCRGIFFRHFSFKPGGDEEIFNFRAQTVANPIKHIKGYSRDNNLCAKVADDGDYA